METLPQQEEEEEEEEQGWEILHKVQIEKIERGNKLWKGITGVFFF